MKTTNFTFAFITCMFVAIPVYADSQNTVSELQARLARDSSPENVKAVAMHYKKLGCDQNAKNFKYEGSKKEAYLNTCMNRNEALLAYESINDRGTLTAESDVNKILDQSPTAAGNK